MKTKNYSQSLIQLLVDLTSDPKIINLDEYHLTQDEILGCKFITRNKKGQLSLKGARFYVGQLKLVSPEFGFVDIENKEEGIYVGSADFNGALHQDEVLVCEMWDKHNRSYGVVTQIIKRHLTQLVGTLLEYKSKLYFRALDFSQKQEIKYTNPSQFQLEANLRVVAKIVEYNPLLVEIIEVLGQQNEPGVDVLSVLRQFNIDTYQTDEVKQQASQYPTKINVNDYPHRRDLRDWTIFTIDGEDTKDIDDAISIEPLYKGYRLGVHIADVSHYVATNSPIDMQARQRGTSVYVVDRVVPMLPVILSNQLCSLNPMVPRLAMSCVMDINEHGEIISYEIFESIIESKQRLTYKEVNRLFDNPLSAVYIEDEIKESLLYMRHCSDLLREYRLKLGACEFESVESDFVIDSKGQVLDIKSKQSGRGEAMIEDFMVAANQTVASVMDNLKLPSLYRVHLSPSDKKLRQLTSTLSMFDYKFNRRADKVFPMDIQKVLNSFKSREDFSSISSLILRCMSKAKYYNQNLGHFGLAIQHYCHFTSPIRRYPDLIVHRFLKKYYLHPDFNHEDLAADEKLTVQLAKETSDLEVNATYAQREVEKIKKAQFMANFVGEKFTGVISGVTKFGFFVQLNNTCEGLVHLKTLDDYYVYNEKNMRLISKKDKEGFGFGQKVKVLVKSVDLVENEVNFVFISHKKGDKRKWKK